MDNRRASKSFQKLVATLNKSFENRFFLTDGTLLGLVRENDFIAQDIDIDIGVWIKDFEDFPLQELIDAGFAHASTEGDGVEGLQIKLEHGSIKFDIIFFCRGPEHFWNMVYHGRKGNFRSIFPPFELEKSTFQGCDVMVPSPPQAYINANYGEKWRQPVSTWDYRYNQHNIHIEGGWIRQSWHGFKKAIWKLKNPDIYRPPTNVGGKVIFTDGVFDLFHANHLALLQEASLYGDRLVVGVVGDTIAAAYKRPPIIPELERLRIIRSIRYVDEAFIIDDPMVSANMDKIIARYGVSKVVYAGDSAHEFYENVTKAGNMIGIPYHEGVNTSTIIKRAVQTIAQNKH